MYITRVVKNGRRIAYYEVMDDNGNFGKMTKDQVAAEIRAGRCKNAKLQVYYGSTIIRIVDDKKANSNKKAQSNKNNCANVHNTQHNKIAILSGYEATEVLLRCEIGTPLKIKVTEYNGFEQVIFCGIKDIQSREAFVFFNGQGIDGRFALSSSFIMNNANIQIKMNDNEPSEVTRLMQMLGVR